jgi:hypothetical protein
MLVCSVLPTGEMSACMTGFPEYHPRKIMAVVGVSGPEVEANWIQRDLEKYGLFDRMISKLSKDESISTLVELGHTEASARVWADRYYV